MYNRKTIYDFNTPAGHASEMFMDAQDQRYGSVYVECNCGITHLAVDSRDWYDDMSAPQEREGLRHHKDCDSIGSCVLNGMQFVDECDGCRTYLKRYEDFIWNERNTIRQYLNMRIDQEKRWADQETVLNKLMEE